MGLAGIFLFHMVENVGMTIGLLPITGVPLPFVSYGGSSLLTSFICIGLLLNISGNRKKTIYMAKGSDYGQMGRIKMTWSNGQMGRGKMACQKICGVNAKEQWQMQKKLKTKGHI